jgi:hypothetical protein
MLEVGGPARRALRNALLEAKATKKILPPTSSGEAAILKLKLLILLPGGSCEDSDG